MVQLFLRFAETIIVRHFVLVVLDSTPDLVHENYSSRPFWTSLRGPVTSPGSIILGIGFSVWLPSGLCSWSVVVRNQSLILCPNRGRQRKRDSPKKGKAQSPRSFSVLSSVVVSCGHSTPEQELLFRSLSLPVQPNLHCGTSTSQGEAACPPKADVRFTLPLGGGSLRNSLEKSKLPTLHWGRSTFPDLSFCPCDDGMFFYLRRHVSPLFFSVDRP